jgi:hypothetical protein
MKESYSWLITIIVSVTHPFQIECCHNLIHLFRQKYTTEDGFGQLYDALLKAIETKDALLTV